VSRPRAAKAALTSQLQAEKAVLGGAEDLEPATFWQGDPDIVSLRSTLLFGLRGMAAYAWHIPWCWAGLNPPMCG